MKKSISTLIIGMILGALLFSGLTVFADLAVSSSTQKVFVDGKEVTVDAYNINGSNYFKARDFAAAMDIGMWYKADTNSVMIETDKGYDPDYTGVAATAPSSGAKTATETLLLDRDNIKITYKGAKLEQYIPGQANAYALYVTILVENNSDKDITVYPTDSSVNDVMSRAFSGLPCDVLAGKKATWSFFFTALDGTGIESVNDISNVEKVELKFMVTGESITDKLFTSDTITIYP